MIQAPSNRKENDVQYTISLYEETMLRDMFEYKDPIQTIWARLFISIKSPRKRPYMKLAKTRVMSVLYSVKRNIAVESLVLGALSRILQMHPRLTNS